MKRKDFLKNLLAIPFVPALLKPFESKANELSAPEIGKPRLVTGRESHLLGKIADIQELIRAQHPGCLIKISRRPNFNIKVSCQDGFVFAQHSVFTGYDELQEELDAWRCLEKMSLQPKLWI